MVGTILRHPVDGGYAHGGNALHRRPGEFEIPARARDLQRAVEKSAKGEASRLQAEQRAGRHSILPLWQKRV